MGRIRSFVDEWRPSAVTLGAPVFPLLVLFGLNAVDELDRSAFAVLLPDIRDHFGLSNAAILGVVSFTSIAILLIEIPLSFYCDRHNRVRIATVGAAMWGLFAIGTGLSISVAMLIVMRFGAGLGRSIVTPTHNGLLSDWYAPEARMKVFSFHRLANSIGQIIGPALGGALGLWFGWRSPFFLFSIPTIILVLLALRLREPVRGVQERLAAGATAEQAAIEDTHESVWATMKVLARVRTLRRIWYAVPFLAVALFGIGNLLSLVYEDVFDLNSAERGLIAAFIEPLQLVGVVLAAPRIAKVSATRPDFLLRFIAFVGIFDGLMLVALAYSPNVGLAIICNAVLSTTVGTLAPAFAVMISLVSPPRCRSAAFSTISVFGIPGIAIVLPLIGVLADSLGPQASMITLVPVTVMAGWMLSRAAPFVAGDIDAVRTESLARVAADAVTPPPASPPESIA
jgi:MFS family permease